MLGIFYACVGRTVTGESEIWRANGDVSFQPYYDHLLSFPELAQSLWKHVFPHIRQRINDPTITHVYLNQLMNLAVGFTLLSINV